MRTKGRKNFILRYFRRKGGSIKNAWTKTKAAPRNTKEFFKALPSRARSATPYDIKVFLMGHGRMGQGSKRGFIPTLAVYALAIPFAFVFLYPLFYMVSYSFMSPSDLVNPLIRYLPTSFYRANFVNAVRVLEFWPALGYSIYIAAMSAVFQTVAVALVAYGLARYRFPGKKIIFALILITFLLPVQILIMPQQRMFMSIGILHSELAYFVPALFGQGFRSAIFILVFYQFYRAIPKSLEEAAKMDGANALMIFIKVSIPLTIPAYLLSFLLSFVWYYNESVLNFMLLGSGSNSILSFGFFGRGSSTLVAQLATFRAGIDNVLGAATRDSEAIYMAGAFLCVLPLLILYFFTQRFFVQGIDKSGLTGE